jgi:hypothetical protein
MSYRAYVLTLTLVLVAAAVLVCTIGAALGATGVVAGALFLLWLWQSWVATPTSLWPRSDVRGDDDDAGRAGAAGRLRLAGGAGRT